MRTALIVAWLLASATRVEAGDTLKTGAPPAWIVPVSAPAARPDAQGAVDIRLIDLQTIVDDRGEHVWVHQILKPLSAAGLQAVGNAIVQWQPQFGDATVHLVRIHRDGQSIDALKDGKAFSTLRREQALESAQLDGTLTAVMPIPDVRVGDEVEIAFSVDRANPVLAGHVEFDTLLAPQPVPDDRFYMRYSWPEGRALRWRLGDGLPKAAIARAGGSRTLVVDRLGFNAPPLVEGAPARFWDANRLQLADFTDWGQVAALMTPLFEHAATLASGSTVSAEIARIAAASPDPKARATAALALVQSQVRYLADMQGLGGYTPAGADAVWAARAGDCKGKTVLLLALLRGLGISASPVLVSARQGDGLDASLPMPGRFDHVLVRATIAGRTYWLDGTRFGDRRIDAIATPGFAWGLPLETGSAKLIPLVATAPSQPQAEWRLDLDARAGTATPAKATATGILRGDAATQLAVALQSLETGKRDEALRQLWAGRHDWITIDKVGWSIDATTGDLHLTMAGTGTMNWNEDGQPRYEANKARLGRDLAGKRDGAGATVPVRVDADYEVAQQTILLPDGGRGYTIEGETIDQTIGGVHYQRSARLRDGRFDMIAISRNPAEELAFADAKLADAQTDTIFAKRLFVRRPAAAAPIVGSGTRAPTVLIKDAQDPRVAAEVTPLIAQRDYAGALQRTDALIAGGKSAELLAMRGALLGQLDRGQEADFAFDEALAIDARNLAAIKGKLARLIDARQYDDALILQDRLVLLAPENSDTYRQRARIRRAAHHDEAALADYAILLDRQPDDLVTRETRLNLELAMGRHDAALAEARAYAAQHTDSETAQAALGNVLAATGHRDDAKAALAQSIALRPNGDAYYARLAYDLSGAAAARLADVLALIRTEPATQPPARVIRSLAADPANRAAIDTAYVFDPTV